MKLEELAKTIRSKNAGVDHITFDIIFDNPENYKKVKKANIITKEYIAKLYRVTKDRISFFTYFEPAQAIKFSIRREKPSGSPGDADTYGCQQYAPLLKIEIP